MDRGAGVRLYLPGRAEGGFRLGFAPVARAVLC